MLRHRVDLGELSGVDRSVEKNGVLGRYRAAHRVEFRRGGDLGVVAEAMVSHKTIELCAAVGAGKSTAVPSLIAKTRGALVIHTIPFGIAARYLAEYLMNRKEQGNVTYVDDIESDLPSHGVVLMSNATFASRYMNHRFDLVKGAILYLDETHESDCWTAVIRKVSPGLDCFVNVVQATATAGPADRMPVHLPGSRKEIKYRSARSETWTAEDAGQPWSIASIDGNTLICLDDPTTRERLAGEYRLAGFDVHLLDSHSSYDVFLAAMRALKARGGIINILIVDYAYRSSFTIPGLERIIDSCEVGIPLVEDGFPRLRHRPAFDFEVQQLFGRGGRVEGENVVLYRSDKPSPQHMCDLEMLEADAANLLYRMMGFRPPPELAAFEYFDGDVPCDLPAAFLSDHPLKCCPVESREPWVNGTSSGGGSRIVEQSRFNYSVPKRGKSKHMTCATDYDEYRPRSPPPAVPREHAVTRAASREFEQYANSRSSSPSPTVYTLESAAPDTLSMFERRDSWSGGRPKRVAKRVQEERAAQEAKERQELEAREMAARTAAAVVDSVPMASASILDVPDMPVAMPTLVPDVPPKDDVPFSGLSAEVRGLRQKLQAQGDLCAPKYIPDDRFGAYFYYPGIQDAPKYSVFFLQGYSSVVAFASDRNARAHIRSLPEPDRMFAMRQLIEKYNDATGTVVGIQRILTEISRRKASDFEGTLDRQQLVDSFDRMLRDRGDAELIVRTCRDFIPLFAKCDLVEMPRAHQLEQTVMHQMMGLLEDTVVRNDPGRMDDYLQSLNDRGPRLIQSVGGLRSQRYLE